MQRPPKEICWPDNRNLEKKMLRTRKLVQKEIQNKNSQIHQKEWWNRIPSPANRTHHRLCKQKILGEEKSYWRRLITEGLEIKKLPITKRANMQSGYEIDPCWDDILKIQGTWTPGPTYAVIFGNWMCVKIQKWK